MGVPRPRTCCILAGGLHSDDDNIIDSDDLGHHMQSSSKVAGGGKTGIMYFKKLGIVDFGHLCDLCDLAKYIYDNLTVMCAGVAARRAAGVPGTCTLNANARIQTPNGHADVTSPLTAADLMPLARSIAYDDSVGYEIDTYFEFRKPAHHTSSFSLEDLPSNYLGTWVCAEAVTRSVANKSVFDNEVDAVLRKLCTDMEAQPAATTRHVFEKYIKGRWVSKTVSWASNEYLRRRNFTGEFWDPLVDHPGCTPFDASGASQGLGNGRSLDAYASKYRFTLHAKPPCTRGEFPQKFENIRAQAKQRYGPRYDSPSDPSSPIPKPPKPPEDRLYKDREFYRQYRLMEEQGGSRGAAPDERGGQDRFAASDTMPRDEGAVAGCEVEQET